MSPPETSEQSIADFLSGYPPEIRAICARLRRLVTSVAPDACEIPNLRQNHIAYSSSDKMRDCILYICPLLEWVRLGFYYGGGLDDPAHLVVGEGKRMRHVKVRSVVEADAEALRLLTAAAWSAGVAAHAR
ncbi:MAG TPA: DUF1801 domain-containing protein [Ktedonobacterales bacterium]